MRSKGICMSEKSYGLGCIWSSRWMFGLKCMLLYIISDI